MVLWRSDKYETTSSAFGVALPGGKSFTAFYSSPDGLTSVLLLEFGLPARVVSLK